ncbi:MAG: 16S rRNA (uracil(1498)-N(3))-methyltransferase [Candidatus Azambacteria bacterium]|nr:16S rRNA (uracil(1498)-N(3))-methyltransferase [Candidatus Azambacteria bacterium]
MRFFINQPIAKGAKISITDTGMRHQLVNVLRRKTGDTIIVLDGKGNEADAVIQSITKDEVVVTVGVCGKNKNESKYPVTLYQSVLKKDNMEIVFEKCTEVGVSRFVPMLSEHSVKQGVNFIRARKIVQEAAEQSRRGVIPEISETHSFNDAVKEAQSSGAICVIAHNEGEIEHIGDFARAHDLSGGINVCIGPEGGFSDAEIVYASQNGFHIVSLGKRTLRAETAAIVACFSVAE